MAATLSDEILSYYAEGHEDGRLRKGRGRLEYERTLEIVGRLLPDSGARILDVGGGTGIYAEPLLKAGHEVTLIDPVPLHVEQALRVVTARGGRAVLGDARDLSEPDDSYDLVLLLGPLYHLTENADRDLALREARRVLRPGGAIVASVISRFASTLDGLRREYVLDPEFEAIIERDLAEGQHRNESNRSGWFTTAYFHRPEQLASELRVAGFRSCELFAVEGPAWMLPAAAQCLESPDERDIVLRAIRRIETEPSLMGASAHILGVARKAA